MKKIIFALFLNACLANEALSILKIDITKGNVDPLPLALNIFKEENSLSTNSLGHDIYKVIHDDLEGCGLFRMISPDAFLQKMNVSTVPNYSSWRQINANAIIAGSIYNESGSVRVDFKILDPYTESQLDGVSYSVEKKNWRRVAHRIADRIYEKMTGEKGMFDTRILYVAESGSYTKRVKRLAIMDQDGANNKVLTDGRYLALTPRFDFNSHRAIYMSYNGKVPQVYILDLASGRQKLLGKFPGMSFAPRFAPDGQSAIMSIAKGGTTNIFSLNFMNNRLQKLTNDVGAINTSPSYAPDGSKIVFNSDRGGGRQLYTMNSDGSNITRISHGGGSYSTPVWSPKGDYIAFTKQSSGSFYIGVMRPDGSGERLLTSSWMEEGPTWSPNGRVIMYSRQSGRGSKSRNELRSVDLTGSNEHLIKTHGSASYPAWSPLLP